MIAQRSPPVDAAKQLILGAMAIADEEAQAALADWPLDIIGERFEAENISIDLAANFFHWWTSGEEAKADALFAIGRVVPRLTALVDKLEKHRNGIDPDQDISGAPSYVISPQYRLEVLNRTQTMVLRNLFAIEFQVNPGSDQTLLVWNLLRGGGNATSQMNLQGHRESRSFYVQTLMDCGRVFFNDGTHSIVRAARDRLEKIRDGYFQRQHLLFPFDAQRYSMLARNALSSRGA